VAAVSRDDAHLQALASRLRDAGGRQLPDVFMFPVARDGQLQCSSYAITQTVGWRENAAEFYLRAAKTPFDLHTFRRRDPRRAGAVFSLGPGLVDLVVHPAVLLLQVEGAAADVNAHADRLLEAFGPKVRLIADDRHLEAEPDRSVVLIVGVLTS
jgi:hypothetical protein